MKHPRSGFTLIELSIVIVLMGLISGMVIAGQGLLRRQQIRNVLVDANAYVVAMQQFQLKYGYLPGDFPTATEVWGRADGGTPVTSNCASPLTDTSTAGIQTCNGNGNGIIDDTNCEDYRVWQHLQASGLIAGNYTGISIAAGCAPYSKPGRNVPLGPLRASGFSVYSFGVFDANGPSAIYFDGDYTNAMLFGLERAGDFNINPALKTDVSLEIDRKVDDASPALGNIRALRPGVALNPNCTEFNGVTYEYKQSYTRDVACALLFLNGYLSKK